MSKAKRPIRVLLTLMVGVVVMMFASPAAHAQGYNNTPTLTVSDSSVTSCEVVTITGTNFPPNTTVNITANGTVIGSTMTNASGSFSFPWNTCGVAAGTYTVVATGGATVLSVTVTVSAGATTTTIPTTNLPVTGSDSTTGLARMGAGFVAVGALLVLVARRRFQAASAA